MTLAKFDFSKTGAAGFSGVMRAFKVFVKYLKIDSKETGVGPLKFYRSQTVALEQISEGIKNGVRSFTVLKGRQLGMSTLFLAIDMFWLWFFPGTQGAIVVDDESSRDTFRNIIDRYIEGLPKELRSGIKTHNRNQLVFANGSILYYLIAGTRKKGSFGHGKGLNFVHATELSRYGDPEAWASFVSALAEENPNRLFLFESTARGFNLFSDIWDEAIESTEKVALFLGWWTKETYRIKRGSRAYEGVMQAEYTKDEHEKIAAVKEQYGVDIDDEQVAWYRAKSRELMSGEAGYIDQEFPWTAADAFLHTGRVFFPIKHVNIIYRIARERKFMGFRYVYGTDFTELEVEQVNKVKEAQLRVWEPPSKIGHYAVGADPAYGDSVQDNQWRDRFAITVLRCYADRVVQVAEFAADNIEPTKFAWVIAHICGLYKNTRLVLELNGPGTNVFQELKAVRHEINSGHLSAAARKQGIHNTLGNMSYYLYTRQDSFSASNMLHFKSTGELKGQIMRRMRDSLVMETSDIRSVPLIEEMRNIVEQDGFIGGEGRKKDDRTLAFALAHKGYDDWLRTMLSAQNQTYAIVSAREKTLQSGDKTANFASHILADHFRTKRLERMAGGTTAPGEWQFEIKDRM